MRKDGQIRGLFAVLVVVAAASSANAVIVTAGADGTIYQSLLFDTNLYLIDPNNGSIIESTDLADETAEWYDANFAGSYCYAEPAIGPDGTVYVGFDDPYLRAVEPNGAIKWVTRLGDVGGFDPESCRWKRPDVAGAANVPVFGDCCRYSGIVRQRETPDEKATYRLSSGIRVAIQEEGVLACGALTGTTVR